jgi:hypothetical protein
MKREHTSLLLPVIFQKGICATPSPEVYLKTSSAAVVTSKFAPSFEELSFLLPLESFVHRTCYSLCPFAGYLRPSCLNAQTSRALSVPRNDNSLIEIAALSSLAGVYILFTGEF